MSQTAAPKESRERFFCPRCDKVFPKGAKTYEKLSSELLRHVSEQHPDYDPEWHDTYPDDTFPKKK